MLLSLRSTEMTRDPHILISIRITLGITDCFLDHFLEILGIHMLEKPQVIL